MPALFMVGPGMLALLKLLQDGRFHSGEALGASLGVSRSAIWKQLQSLEAEFGVEVFKVPGRGYRLASPMSLLDDAALLEAVPACQGAAYVMPSLDSTNAEVFRRLQGESAPFWVFAERQTAGRGRRGRPWASPFGENLYGSLLVRVDGGARQVEALSLTVGLAVARTLQAFGVVGAGLKWPNDILVNGQKISGILLELSGDPADVCHVVIGIGINVNMAVDSSASINQPWISVRQVVGHVMDRGAMAIELMRQVEAHLARHWLGGFALLREDWESLHLWRGREAVLMAGDKVVRGCILGVDDGGGIRLLVDGVERVFSGGELSLRLQHDS